MSWCPSREPLVVAVLAALAGSGCCYSEGAVRCLQTEEPVCPSRAAAAELIDADEITGDGVHYPARTYVDGDRTYEYPAECCYETESVRCEEMNGFGRPYLRAGRAVIARPIAAPSEFVECAKRSPPRLAAARRRRPVPLARDLPADVRGRLAAVWRRRGALEHAAVASFGRFALDLVALGAPEGLVREALRAIRDEARHARAAFEIAVAFGDVGHRSGVLAVDPSLYTNLVGFVRGVVHEGCVAETVGVAILEARAAGATDAGMRRVLRGLSREEARHADLGWRALAWALAAGGEEVRRAAAERLGEAVAEHGTTVRAPAVRPTPREVALGELEPAVMSAVVRGALRERVAPRAAALGLEAVCARG